MVYAMIMESDQYKEVNDFTETELYKRCVAAGVIPDANAILKQNEKTGTDDSTWQAPSRGQQKERSVDAPKPVTGETLDVSFRVENMWCPACAWIVEDALRKTDGVIQASCNFSSDRGKVVYDPVQTSPDQIMKIVKNLGYGASPLEESQKKSVREFVRLAVTILFTMNIMMISWSIYTGFIWELSRESVQLLSWPVMMMATIVLFYGGYPIHIRTVAGIRARTPGMETLITVGSFTAYLYSVMSVFQGSIHLYFDASSMLILLILIGKKLEQSARDRISTSLADFFSLAPEKVRLCTEYFPNGRYVSVKQLAAGDVLRADEGEILAADGEIIEGEGLVDESSITGEPKPQQVSVHDRVKSGTRMLSGSIRVKATQVAEASILGKMMTIMENSLSGKTRQAARFEGLLRFFVPAVIGFAVLTFSYGLLTGQTIYVALNRGLSVMVISCPCALGIAIPLALVAGVSIAGKRGILVRDFEAFEQMLGLDSIVFDKTGTITSGKLNLLTIETTDAYSKDQVLEIAAALEAESKHYIALAIRSYAEENDKEPQSLESIEHFENGISGIWNGIPIRVGNRDFVGQDAVRKSGLTHNPSTESQVISEVYLSIDDEVVALMVLGDSLRTGVPGLVGTLNDQQYSLYLISGDAERATHSVAKAAGIPDKNTSGSMLPHEKAAFIVSLKREGKKVAMVGDGVNDAPAMAESHLAVAVHSGLNPGEGVASITLMQEDPRQILEFFKLADAVNRTVKQNLAGALIYNLIGIPIAASGLLNPVIAVTAMLCSSLSVTFNTLRMVNREMKNKPSTASVSLKPVIS